MKSDVFFHIAIAGNPNVGKSTLFNQLTGLRQKTGNYAGVTVEKKQGYLHHAGETFLITDLPGTYSIYPRSEDESVVHRVLCTNSEKPDALMIVVNAGNPERGLLLATQVIDLGIPCMLVFNMTDEAENQGMHWNAEVVEEKLGIPVLKISARKPESVQMLIEAAAQKKFRIRTEPIFAGIQLPDKKQQALLTRTGTNNLSEAFRIWRSQGEEPDWKTWEKAQGLSLRNFQKEETVTRYRFIGELMSAALERKAAKVSRTGEIMDRLAMHPVAGYVLFFLILALIFQAVFAWAEMPMNAIDEGMALLAEKLDGILPEGPVSELLTRGLIPGVAGVLMFIPQILLLFLFLAMLEDSGYMSRVVFLMDRWMRPLGLHGKSMVPLVSGIACAIPAVMATRPISNRKERLITLLVTPFMSCSARIPVYIVLIGLVVPDENLGPLHLRGLALTGMYMLGAVTALLAAFILKLLMKTKGNSFLMLELPPYRFPRLKDIGLMAYTKVHAFVTEAGKVIVSVSLLIWVLSNYGPPEQMKSLRETEQQLLMTAGEAEADSIQKHFQALKLESSYMGYLGRGLEPAIRPLGYDWKLGIALVSSFAAREVFVSTLSVIYAMGDDAEPLPVQERLRRETRPDGSPVFSKATALSLLVFYAFALQCLSTVAVVYKETRSLKLTILQWLGMTTLAWISAWAVFHLFQ